MGRAITGSEKIDRSLMYGNHWLLKHTSNQAILVQFGKVSGVDVITLRTVEKWTP
jgi:hypothetical protein